MKTAERIYHELNTSDKPLAVHELGERVNGASQTSISARLREMRRDGQVFSIEVPGKRFTKWAVIGKSYGG